MQKKYDLEERTTVFGKEVIYFAKMIPENAVTRPIIVQFVKSGTSIGANYCEADDAESRKDFQHKIGICKKESRETKYWLGIIISSFPRLKDEADKLRREAIELNLIFNAINNKLKLKN